MQNPVTTRHPSQPVTRHPSPVTFRAFLEHTHAGQIAGRPAFTPFTTSQNMNTTTFDTKPRREIRALSMRELMALPRPTMRELIASQIGDAANCLRGKYLEGAAWRLADASADLRQLKSSTGADGMDQPTGRGAILGGTPEQLAVVLAAQGAGAAPVDPPLLVSLDAAVTLLEDAQAALIAGAPGAAVWRMADAGLLLRQHLERAEADDVQGFDTLTGLHALLGGAPHQLAAVLAR